MRRKSLSLSQRILLSFFDLGTFFCASVVVLWGLIFPILRPIVTPDFPLYLLGQKSLVIGLYTGLILCTIVVVFRVALQFLLVRPPSSGVMLPAPQSVLAQQVDNSDKKSLEDSLSSIRSELAMLREEMSSFRLSRVWSPRGGAVRVESSADSSGWAGDVEPISLPVSRLPVSPTLTPMHPTAVGNLMSNAGSQIPAVVPPENERATGSFELPDSAKDNPWASVLSGRQARAMPAKPIGVEVILSTPEMPEPLPPEIMLQSGASPPPVNSASATSAIEPPNLDDVLLPNPIEFAEPKPEIIDVVSVPANSISEKSPEETDFVVPVSFEEMESRIIEGDTARESKPIEIIASPEDIAVPRPDEALEITPPGFTEILETRLSQEERTSEAKIIENYGVSQSKPIEHVAAPEEIATSKRVVAPDIAPVETKPHQEEPPAEVKQAELEPSLAEIMVWKPEISEPPEAAVPVQLVEVAPAVNLGVPESTPVENAKITPAEQKKVKSARKPRKTKRSTKNGKSSATRSN